MRVLIVDDEAPARARLVRLLEQMPDVKVCGQASSGTEAVESIARLEPDLVLLDIQMPGADGFEVVEQVGVAAMPPVVFVTAYDEHALRAFEVHALDYLLKPVSVERLTRAMERVRALTAQVTARDDQEHASSGDPRLHALLETMGRRPALKHLLVQADERAYMLPVAELVRATSERNYVRLFTRNGSYRIRGTIGALAERLDQDDFLQLSRSDLVRVSAIREMHPWSHGDYQVLLHDGTRLVWSRRYRARAEGRFEG